jgi:hypothetical protein
MSLINDASRPASAEIMLRRGEKQPGRQYQRSTVLDTWSQKHEIASVCSYRHRRHDRDAGNGTNDNPLLQCHGAHELRCFKGQQ